MNGLINKLWRDADVILLIDDTTNYDLFDNTVIRLLNTIDRPIQLSCCGLTNGDPPVDMLGTIKDSRATVSVDSATWKMAMMHIEWRKGVLLLETGVLDITTICTLHSTITPQTVAASAPKVTLLRVSDMQLLAGVSQLEEYPFGDLGKAVLHVRQTFQLGRLWRTLFGNTVLRNVRCVGGDSSWNVLVADGQIVHSPSLDRTRYYTYRHTVLTHRTTTQHALFPFLSHSPVYIYSYLLVHPTGEEVPHSEHTLFVHGSEIISPHCRIFCEEGLFVEAHGYLRVNHSPIVSVTRLHPGDVLCVGHNHMFCVDHPIAPSLMLTYLHNPIPAHTFPPHFTYQLLRVLISLQRHSPNLSPSLCLPPPFVGWTPGCSTPLCICVHSPGGVIHYSEMSGTSRVVGTAIVHAECLVEGATHCAEVMGEGGRVVGDCYIGVKRVEDEFDENDNYVGDVVILKSVQLGSIGEYTSVGVSMVYHNNFKSVHSQGCKTVGNVIHFAMPRHSFPINSAIAFYLEFTGTGGPGEDRISVSCVDVCVRVLEEKEGMFRAVPVDGMVFQLREGRMRRLSVEARGLPVGGVTVKGVQVSSVGMGEGDRSDDDRTHWSARVKGLLPMGYKRVYPCSGGSVQLDFERTHDGVVCEYTNPLSITLSVDTSNGTQEVTISKHIPVQYSSVLSRSLVPTIFHSSLVCYLLSPPSTPSVDSVIDSYHRNREYQVLECHSHKPTLSSVITQSIAEASSAVINRISHTFRKKDSLQSVKSKIATVFSRPTLDMTVNPFVSTSPPKSTTVQDVWSEEEDALGELDGLGDVLSEEECSLMETPYLPGWLKNGRSVRLSHSGMTGVVRFVGRTHVGNGFKVGVELDSAVGDCDGKLDGVVYFRCRHRHGIFVVPHNVELNTSSPTHLGVTFHDLAH